MNVLLVVSVAILSFAFIFVVIGAATEEWIKHGLHGLLPVEDYYTDKLKASAALVIIGLVGSIVSLGIMGVCLILDLMGKMTQQTTVLPTVSLIVAWIGAISGIVGCIIFATIPSGDPEFGYSFALTIVGCIFLAVGGTLGKVAGKSNTQVG